MLVSWRVSANEVLEFFWVCVLDGIHIGMEQFYCLLLFVFSTFRNHTIS